MSVCVCARVCVRVREFQEAAARLVVDGAGWLLRMYIIGIVVLSIRYAP